MDKLQGKDFKSGEYGENMGERDKDTEK